jgi:hypothetical protein
MKNLRCPKCEAQVASSELLSHPLGQPDGRRSLALIQSYCPACGAEIALQPTLSAIHVIVALLALSLTIFAEQLSSQYEDYIKLAAVILVILVGSRSALAYRACRR